MYMSCHLWVYAAYIYGHPFICNDCSHATCEFTRLIYMDMIAVMPLVNLRGLHVWTSFFFFLQWFAAIPYMCVFHCFIFVHEISLSETRHRVSFFFQMGLGERGQFKKMGGSRGQPDLPWSKRVKIECKEIVLIKSTVHP